MNILFVSIEDLNDFVEPLRGHPQIVTPNISALARRSRWFSQAYATAPACSPSRTAVLFGKAPWSTGVYSNDHAWTDAFPRGERLSIFGHARDAGFATIGAGKIFHNASEGIDQDDWSEYLYSERDAFSPRSKLAKLSLIKSTRDYGPSDNGESQYDERNVNALCKRINRGDDFRFWALGLYRPHLPFIAPKRFFDLYPDRPTPPPGLGRPYDPFDLSDLDGIPFEARQLTLRRGLGKLLAEHDEYHSFLRAYLASISYADHLLGEVLRRIDDEGLLGSTYVVLWSDHGWQFGEKHCFRKFTLWERALRIPILVSGPGVRPGEVKSPISNLDLFPTILSMLDAKAKRGFDGVDLLRPSPDFRFGRRRPVVSVWGRRQDAAPEIRLAFSVRSRTHRYTRYWLGGEELYNNAADPYETRNLLRRDAAPSRRDRWRAARLRRHIPEAPAQGVRPALQVDATSDDKISKQNGAGGRT